MSDDGAGDEVASLVRHGRYEEAAALSATRGDREGAIRLYTKVWNFAAAWPLAAELGDWPRAVRLALDARDPERALALAKSVPVAERATRLACAEVLAARGAHAEAAALADAAGGFSEAVAYFKRARDLVGAGGAEERAGRPHEALALYQTAARTAGTPREQARARLAEGKLHARLGHRRAAIRALQAAAREPAWQREAWRALVRPLADEGLAAAAAELASRLRGEDKLVEAVPAPDESLPPPGSPGGSPDDDTRFRVLRDLGGGAAARVMMAEDRLLGRRVALKIVQAGASAAGPQAALAAFHREAEAAARLRHPTIVTLLDVDRAQGVFVLEWMAGGTLAERLAREGQLTPASARRMALDLLDALDVAHGHGIVHRDIKPANVFFDEAGNTKLGDFGSAHLMDFGQTQTGGLLGTVAYMAPEQITAGSASPATDIYALGILLFEALTGQLPFVGPDIVAAHLGEEPRPVRSVRAELSPLHEATLARALTKDPAGRFSSAREMRDEIRRWPEQADARRPAKDTIASEAPRGSRDATVSSPRAASSTRALAPSFAARTSLGELAWSDETVVGLAGWEERLAESPSEPLAWQEVARAGGTHLQRMLDLSPDGRQLVHEVVEGDARPWPHDVPVELQVFARLVAEARGETPPFVYAAPGGWVVPTVWLADGQPPPRPPDAV